MSPIALYLKDNGYNVTLFLLNEYDHFHPQADTNNKVELKIVELGWSENNFSDTPIKSINKTFESFDFFIGTDYAAAFCNKANIQLDIYFPAGTDLSEWPFKVTKNFIPLRWEYNITLCAKAQFYGIKYAKHLAIDPTNENYENLIFKIRGNNIKHENIPYHYLPFFLDNSTNINQIYTNELNEINHFDFKIIQHCRQHWLTGINDIHYKGNELLIAGFKKFIDITKSNSCLILLEYGNDVNHTKSLIKELNLEKNVIWLPKMLRKYIFQFIKLSDIGIGQFGHSWYSSCSINEILMAGKPLISYRNGSLYHNLDKYPLMNANSVSEICSQLNLAYDNHNLIQNLEVKNWFDKKQFKRINEVLKTIKKEELNNNFILNIYNKIKLYPYYTIRYKLLKPISIITEFFIIRIKKYANI